MYRGMLLWMLGLLVIGASHAQAYQLVYKDTTGTARWYRTQIIFYGGFTVQPMNKTFHLNGTVSFTEVEKVLGVGEDGKASIQAKITDGSVFVNLPDLDQPPVSVPITDITISSQRSPTGKVTEITIKGLPLPFSGISGMNPTDALKLFSQTGMGLEFPTGNLQAGATWKNNATIEFMGKNIDSQIANTLQGPRLVDHVNTLQIDSTITMKAPALEFQARTPNGRMVPIHEALDSTVKATTLFDAAAGELFSTWLDGDSNFSITAPMPGADQTVTVAGTLHISGGMRKIPPGEH